MSTRLRRMHVLGFALAVMAVLPSCKERGGAGAKVPGQGPGQTSGPMAATQLPANASASQRELLAQAEAAYLQGDDPQAVQELERLLGAVEGEVEASDAVRLRLAMAQARGGNAKAALATLETLANPELAPLAVASTRARAHAESGGPAALAAWHDMWAAGRAAGDTASATYAQLRATRAWRASSPQRRVEATELARQPLAEQCLQLRARVPGVRADADAEWLSACQPPAAVVGVVLPRTGRFAPLADRHLAALSVGMQLAPPDLEGMVVRFADSASTPSGAASAASALVDEGATVLIGPASEKAALAVVTAVGERARVITPGPSPSPARAMSVSLESRIDALIAHGAQRGCTAKGYVVARARGGYGDRGLKRVHALREGLGPKHLKGMKISAEIVYESGVTSFAPVLKPARGALQRGACVVVLDTLARTELLTRQLRRDGREIGTGGSSSNWVLSTAEGLDAGAIDGRGGLAGIVVAPVALPEMSSAFQDTYRLNTGKAADDQALLIWRALRLALWELPPPGAAEVAQFDGEGHLVVPTTDENPSGEQGP